VFAFFTLALALMSRREYPKDSLRHVEDQMNCKLQTTAIAPLLQWFGAVCATAAAAVFLTAAAVHAP